MPIYITDDLRQALDDPRSVRQVSLRMDKLALFPEDANDKSSRTEFIKAICALSADEAGRKARLDFYTNQLQKARRCAAFRARLMGRLIVNQAGGVIENSGLCLDRHFGVPYIPGSALKGISRDAALRAVGDGRVGLSEVLAVFGWTPGDSIVSQSSAPDVARKGAFAGRVAFLPAYPTSQASLTEDIVTCHHRKYYQDGDPEKVALDTEAPVPNVFPVVEAGVTFLFLLAIKGSERRVSWVRRELDLPDNFDPLAKAQEWLAAALSDHGVGAKTAAGYGWFEVLEETAAASPGGAQ